MPNNKKTKKINVLKSEWDDFLYQIEPIASNIPWMTGIGNHEYSWTGEWKPNEKYVNSDAYGNGDGGGECGVPYNAYFSFANSNYKQMINSKFNPLIVEPWYYINYGRVRIIIISTEHDFSINSTQYLWIGNILNNTDRNLFPWIWLAGHRPMYANDNWNGDTTTAQYLRDCLEHYLYQYNIALAFWGHQHSYGRTCNVYKEECLENKGNKGTVHLIVGMAGYELTKSVQAPNNTNYIQFQNNTIYGFVHLNVINDTHLFGKFIDANTSGIVEDFWITNPYLYNIN